MAPPTLRMLVQAVALVLVFGPNVGIGLVPSVSSPRSLLHRGAESKTHHVRTLRGEHASWRRFQRSQRRFMALNLDEESRATQSGAQDSPRGARGASAAGLIALSSRAKALRELLSANEIRNDLTEAEFALTLFNNPANDVFLLDERGSSSIDFQHILSKLQRHRQYLEERELAASAADGAARSALLDVPGTGQGEKAFLLRTPQQAEAALARIVETTTRVSMAIQELRAEEAEEDVNGVEEESDEDEGKRRVGADTALEGKQGPSGVVASRARRRLDRIKTWTCSSEGTGEGDAEEARGAVQASSSMGEAASSRTNRTKSRVTMIEEQIAVFIREDGTVDVDAAIETGREVVRFSAELWERLNGKPPEGSGTVSAGSASGNASEGTSAAANPVRAIESYPSVEEAKRVFADAQADLFEVRQEIARALAVEKGGGAPTGKGADAEAATTETSTGSAAPRQGPEYQRMLAKREEAALRRARLYALDYDMEKVFTLLALEIDKAIVESWTTSWLAEQRRLVAEYGLLDAQLAVLVGVLREVESHRRGALGSVEDGLLSLVDPYELDVVATQVVELVYGLGISPTDAEVPLTPRNALDGFLQGLVDGARRQERLWNPIRFERIGKQSMSFWNKLESGVQFYTLGTKLLGDDISYAVALLGKAIQGETLSQREARTLQRTAKDLVTVVPFIVILLIPLTPVGHVLVFSFIQRIYPDFFPSTYTERRQNLMKLYDAISPDGRNRNR